MSKHRTSKAAKKRFKVTAGGKLMHRSQKLRHLRSSKSKRQIRSLKRLKTDYVDILQIHDIEFGTEEQVLNEAIPAALKVKATSN